jgi:hypothetical protein
MDSMTFEEKRAHVLGDIASKYTADTKMAFVIFVSDSGEMEWTVVGNDLDSEEIVGAINKAIVDIKQGLYASALSDRAIRSDLKNSQN